MKSIVPYIYFHGHCEEAFNFYQEVLGGKLEFHKFGEMPEMLSMADEAKFSKTKPVEEQIMHISLVTPEGLEIMGCDYYEPIASRNNVLISLMFENKELAKAKEVWAKFAESVDKTKIDMDFDKQFWGYYGQLKDGFGITWAINCDLSEAEIKAMMDADKAKK